MSRNFEKNTQMIEKRKMSYTRKKDNASLKNYVVKNGKVFGGEFAGCGEKQRGRGLTVEIEKCDSHCQKRKNNESVHDRLQKDGRLSATQPDYNFVKSCLTQLGIEAMGFERALVLKVFFACNKNKELAINYLLDHMQDFECNSTLTSAQDKMPAYYWEKMAHFNSSSNPENLRYTNLVHILSEHIRVSLA
ncbi:hypothetical protein LguiB_033172 [Lonicera macranthoides]